MGAVIKVIEFKKLANWKVGWSQSLLLLSFPCACGCEHM